MTGKPTIERKKPRQHHVWQQYLRAWSDEGKVYCLQDDRIFQTGTPVLGMKTDFYKLPPLRNEDITLLFFIIAFDKAHPIIQKYHLVVLGNILGPTIFVEQHRNKFRNSTFVEEFLDSYNTNAVDNQHTLIESLFVPLLARSVAGDFSWYENSEDCINFCNFVAAQNMRTRGVKERTIQRLKERMGIDVSRIWDIVALINGFTLGCNLFLERRQRKLITIRNDTSVPFITSDQPVINLVGSGYDKPPEKLTLYYPISPRIALYMGEPNEPIDLPVHAMTADAAAYLNQKIGEASFAQIYGQTRDPVASVRECLRQ